MGVPETIKRWWPVATSTFVIIGMFAAGMGWYITVKAEEIIEIKMEKRYKGLSERLGRNSKILNDVHRNQGRYEEKFKGFDQKLDLILQFQQRQQRR